MDAYSVYRDIQKRTKGQFLIGVVGPVRTGKSTLIRRFLEVLALPYLSEKEQAEVRDALPLSGEGKTITTVEPKFVPKDAVELQLGEGDPIRLRLIDCVGFLVPDAAGNLENEKERMVKTPWSEQAIPFRVGNPLPNLETLQAIENARKGIGLSRGFSSVAELMEDLNADD